MNKKKLSVVMAGAMLASSVAPVLAATESELDTSRLGSLVEKVYEKITTGKVFSDGDALAGKSVYYVKINGKDAEYNGTKINDMAIATDANKEALRLALQEVFKNLSAGDKVEIYSHGFREEGNKVLSTTTSAEPKYMVSDFAHTEEVKDRDGKVIGWENATTKAIFKILNDANKGLVENNSNVVRVETLSDGKDAIKVYFTANVSALEGTDVSGNPKVLTLKEGDTTYNFNRIKNLNNKEFALTSGVQANQIKSFVKNTKPADKDIENTLEETIKITGVTHNYKTEELYDGLMLTTEGHDMLSLLKSLDKDKNASVKLETLDGRIINKGSNVVLPIVNSEYGFVIKTRDAFNKETVYTIKGAEKQTNVLASWLNTRLAKVDILAGDNRYETAVEIAKEQAQVSSPKFGDNKKITNIVLVNGNALVDGLSAAPLAAKLQSDTNSTTPVLLTEADELPKATRAYLVELMTNHTIGDPTKATIHLVGGTSVLNVSLEKELESFGFKVERYNGANREETSLKVAKKIDANLSTGAFVVGADGEADAMSISGYASMKKIPVIVSKKGGLTYDALKALEDKTVTVIGGESAVSEEEYEAIKEEADAVRRISGENRQATNAAIIKEFYHDGNTVNGINNLESVIVAKDGRGNKNALVDALTAANLAAQTNAPVVLATSSLSADQLDAVQLRAKKADSLYQVGHGVERSVMEAVAARLGLLNK